MSVSLLSSAEDEIIFSNEFNNILPRCNHRLLSRHLRGHPEAEIGTHGRRRQRQGYDGRFSAVLHPLMILFEVHQCRESPSPSPPRKSLPLSALMSPNVLAERPFSLSHWSRVELFLTAFLSLRPAAPRGGGEGQTDGRMERWMDGSVNG